MWQRLGILELERPVTTTEQLAHVFDSAACGQASSAQLRVAVFEYVDFLRDAGISPEKVLICVKRSLGFDPLGNRASNPDQTALVSGAIRDCIRRYYLVAGTQPQARE